MESKKILNKLIDVFQLVEEMNKKLFIKEYNGLNMSDVHTIECIGKNLNCNLTTISKHMKITKSGALKIVKKLLDRGEIEQFQLPHNKKEKYFSLTPQGIKTFEKHEKLHREGEERDNKLFENFSQEERVCIFKFLQIVEEDMEKRIKD